MTWKYPDQPAGPAEPTAEELAIVRKQTALAGFMPYLDEEVARQKAHIEAEAMVALRGGTLTPDKALSFWMQFLMLTNIRKGFDTRVRVGTATGTRINEALTWDRQAL